MGRVDFIDCDSVWSDKNIKMKAHLKTIAIISLSIILFISCGKIWQMYFHENNLFYASIYGLLFIYVLLALIIWLIIIYFYIYEYFTKK